MTAANSLHRRFGRVSLPLAASTESSLEYLDPANQILLDLFAAALNAELAPVWDSAVAGTALEGKDGPSTPVMQRLSAVPDAATLQSVKVAFPLLCVARSSSRPAQGDELSLDKPRRVQLWDVDYLLCPLTVGNEQRVAPVLPLVDSILRSVIEEGGHLAYRTATNQGFTYAQNVLGDRGDNTCRFFGCAVTESAFGPGRLSREGPSFQACSMTLRTEEIGEYSLVDGVGVPFRGTTATFGLAPSGHPSITAKT